MISNYIFRPIKNTCTSIIKYSLPHNAAVAVVAGATGWWIHRVVQSQPVQTHLKEIYYRYQTGQYFGELKMERSWEKAFWDEFFVFPSWVPEATYYIQHYSGVGAAFVTCVALNIISKNVFNQKKEIIPQNILGNQFLPKLSEPENVIETPKIVEKIEEQPLPPEQIAPSVPKAPAQLPPEVVSEMVKKEKPTNFPPPFNKDIFDDILEEDTSIFNQLFY